MVPPVCPDECVHLQIKVLSVSASDSESMS